MQLPDYSSTDFDHLEICLADAAFWANKVLIDIIPCRTGRYALIFVTFGFVVNPAADNALPFFHISSAHFVGSQKRRTL